ncbi:hypothetical protein [Streptomyces griseorubiginosus]|uniref:hypothetical protein n=1 Tax=Streptomyces griseorubiginosus TaxID=67304 RepID=UPI0033C4CF5C
MAAKLSTLADNFGAATLNTTVWNQSSAAPNTQLDTVLDRVAVACTANYYSLGSTPWDATSANPATPNGVYARVTPAPPGNGSTETIFEILLDASNKATLYMSGGNFVARVTNAGVNTLVTISSGWAAFDPYQHAWWRIQEVSGSFVYATSPDGYTWTTRATLAYTWAATNVKFQFVCGYYGTESAGMSAYIDHVNTMTSPPEQPNLNWPMIEEAWAPYWNSNAGTAPLDRYVDVTDRTRGTSNVSRGRQYELDQVRSGEASATLANTDAALDPTNTSGPWAGRIIPYQPYRRRAQWPPTRNLLDQHIATAGDSAGASGTITYTAWNILSDTDSTGGSFVTSASAWQGSTVMQFQVPSGTTAPSRICHTPRPSVVPGQTYTMQMRVRNITASTSLSVKAFIGWYTVGAGTPTSFTYGTTSVLAGSATAAWTVITVTATAPANAAGMDVGVAAAATAAALCNVQVDGWQAEKGSTATTWQCPGVWYPLYAGWVERWTPSWNLSGTYGVVAPQAVDTFSLLSQQTLSDPLTEEINSQVPRFVYKLDDPSGSMGATDWTGNFPAAQIGISKYGAGSLTFGNEITAADATGTYTGSDGTVARIANGSPGQSVTAPASFLRLTSAGIKGPADPTSWARMIAFRYTGPTPTTAACMWSCFDSQRANGTPSGSRIYVYLESSGKPVLSIQGPTGAGALWYPGGVANCVDGDWHLLIFGYNAATSQVMFSLDGATGAFYNSIPATYTPSGLISDNVGAYVDPTVGNGTTWGYQGDISFAAEFTWSFGSASIANLYSAWKSACAGESTNARYARLLRYAGYSGWTSIGTGLTTSMGPAKIDGQDAMSALQAVVDTEAGAHFVSQSGVITFKPRSARYNATTPMYTFGENAAAGEYPYEDISLDYDSTHLSNQVTVTQESTGQNFYATDATSITNYFPRPLSRTINSSSATECQDAANYLLSRYKQSAMRVSSLRLHPSANPALWAVLLNLELGTRVRVMRRPPNVPATQVDCFVENIVWDLDDTGEAWCTLQCSPADLTPYGVFAAWHTTLASSTAAGVTSITVNASQDNTNPLAAQLAAGQSLVLGQGTANQETVTVSAVGATSSGWTTATITLTAATTKAHTAGDRVNEPLPSGVTDPAAYDLVAKFDSAAFAY